MLPSAIGVHSVIEDIFSKGAGDILDDAAFCLEKIRHFEILHTGWLTKRGKVVKSWKRRFFFLASPGVIFYCADESSLQKLRTLQVLSALEHDKLELRRVTEQAVACGLIGSIRVSSNTKIARLGSFDGQERVFSFQAANASKRTFFFSALSDEEIESWEKALRSIDTAEARRVQQQNELHLKEEKEKKEQIRQKYLALLPVAKDPYQGGMIRCGKQLWEYVSGGPGDANPGVLEVKEGRHQGSKYLWNGTIISDGQVALMGDKEGGWGLWSGHRMEWRTPAYLERRGKGQAWEYRTDAELKLWRANDFTTRMNFPRAWQFVEPQCLRPLEFHPSEDIPSEVLIQGSVPPMVALVCGMYLASRKESLFQLRLLHEIQTQESQPRAPIRDSTRPNRANPLKTANLN